MMFLFFKRKQRANATGKIVWISLFLPFFQLAAQQVPTVQQSQFRSQWAGTPVDQIPYSGGIPMNGLGAIVGSLQTQDQVQRELEESLSNLNAKSPFAFKPALGVGWQLSNQGTLNQNPNGNYYSEGSSPFFAPSLAILYDRDHGPWTLSAGYSVAYRYYSNPNFVGGGSTGQQNPLNHTAFFKCILEMSHYVFDAILSASAGSGFDSASGGNNRQTTLAANANYKYIFSDTFVAQAKAGYTLQNASGSVATPNNDNTTFFANLAPIYEYSDKTHLSSVFGVGDSTQMLAQGSAYGTNTALTSNQTSSISYAQLLGKVKYDFTAKTTFDVAFGARYLGYSNIPDASRSGIQPAWTLGFSYTPTEKTSMTLSMGEQGTDIRPELNFLLSWTPRAKTQFSLALNQGQGFANSVASQYQITRSILGTMTQKIYTSLDFSLSGGYAEQQFVSLSSSIPSQANGQTPSNYLLATASLNWKIRDWVILNNSIFYSGGETVRGPNGSTIPQSYYAISLNFTL